MYYEGIGPEQGTVVSDEDAYDYALERSLSGTENDKREFREMLIKWFYSGNWSKKGDVA